MTAQPGFEIATGDLRSALHVVRHARGKPPYAMNGFLGIWLLPVGGRLAVAACDNARYAEAVLPVVYREKWPRSGVSLNASGMEAVARMPHAELTLVELDELGLTVAAGTSRRQVTSLSRPLDFLKMRNARMAKQARLSAELDARAAATTADRMLREARAEARRYNQRPDLRIVLGVFDGLATVERAIRAQKTGEHAVMLNGAYWRDALRAVRADRLTVEIISPDDPVRLRWQDGALVCAALIMPLEAAA